MVATNRIARHLRQAKAVGWLVVVRHTYDDIPLRFFSDQGDAIAFAKNFEATPDALCEMFCRDGASDDFACLYVIGFSDCGRPLPESRIVIDQND
jgi:hypothetical protein